MILKDGLDFHTFVDLIDNIYDEIFIWDETMTVVYANKACYRHYGMRPDQFVGKSILECTEKEKLWTPTSVFDIFVEKKPVIQNQKTFLGVDIVTISVPMFDENNQVKYVIQSVRDNYHDLYKRLTPMRRGGDEEVLSDGKFIYKSKVMEDILTNSKKIAKTKAPILILGETGTGKSLMAKYIHEKSDRKDKPFVSINMASLSPTIIESEFFGYKKGAFTGANREGKQGLFEIANGGTLFLDEIGEFPLELQAKFLHTIQEEEVTPVGGLRPIALDIRIICATNCDLKKMVDAGKFRQDLYHRLNMFEITIPPLRKRKEDLLLFVSYFLNVFNKKYGKSIVASEKVMEAFLRYPWDGNVREISNVIERGVITSEGVSIELNNLPESFFAIENTKKNEGCIFEKMSYDDAIEEYEKNLIQNAYEIYKTTRKVASVLKISQSKASRLIRKYVDGAEA